MGCEASVVLFRDEEGNVDFGLLTADGKTIICFCCGSIFEREDVEILWDFDTIECLEEAVAAGGFYDELPDELKPLYTGPK